jgi:Lon protease-like protein
VDLPLPSSPVPVFPLRGIFLFPHQALPLHIFEPRYRQMVGDLLDGPGRLVLASPVADPGEGTDLPEVAGLGEILRHEKLPDGRYMIWVHGLSRVRIEEVPSDRLYRRVQVTAFEEQDVSEDEAAELVPELRAATSARLQEPLPLPDDAPTSLLTDLLLQAIGTPLRLLEHAYAEPSVAARARFALRQSKRSGRRRPPKAEPGAEPDPQQPDDGNNGV